MGKKDVPAMSFLSVCLFFAPSQLTKNVTKFHESWCGHYALLFIYKADTQTCQMRATEIYI